MKISKRLKLVLGIIIAALVILSGTIFALGKTGTINLRSFADEFVVRTQQLISKQAGTNVYISITRLGGSPIPDGTAIIFRNQTTGTIYTQTVTDPGVSQPLGTFTFTNVAVSNYIGDESKCVRVHPFSTVAGANNYATGEIIWPCTPGQTAGTYSISGKVVDGANGNASIANARVAFDNDSSKTAVTDVNGNYVLNGLPYNPSLMANHAFTYVATGYTPRSLTLQNGLHQNPSSIAAGGNFNVPSVALTKDTSQFQYKITGNIIGTSGNLAGAEVKLVDKTATPPTQLTSTTTVGGTYSGKNYLSNKFGSAGFDKVYLQISVAGYTPLEVKLLDPEVILTRTASGSGTNVFELMTIKDLILTMPQPRNFDLQGIVRDKNNTILSGVTVTVLCPVADASPARTRCESKRVNGVDPTTTSRSNLVKTHGQDQNFLISNLYNIAQAGAEFNNYRLAISKPGYYYDSNSDGQMNAGEDALTLLITPDRILPPQNSTENAYYAINLDQKLLSETMIGISGKATKSLAEKSAPLKDAELELKDLASGTTTTKKSLADGTYNFTGLVLTHKYRITCRYSGRTTQSREVVAISGQGATVDFIMNVNADFQHGGYVTGHIYKTKDGVNTPLNKASVALYIIENDKKIPYKKVVSDDKGHFVIRLDPADLFVIEGNGQTVGDWNFRLQAGSLFPLLKNSYDFTLHWREGIVYEQDIYMAYDSDSITGKTVDVTVIKETRDFTSGKVLSTARAVGVPIWLTQTSGSGGESSLTSTVLHTGKVATKANGTASFSPLEKFVYNIAIESPSGYTLDPKKSQTTVSAEGSAATIYIYTDSVPGLSLLNKNINKYYFAQGVGDWKGDRGIFNRDGNTDTVGETPNRTIKEVGCCLTSIAISMNRYLPALGINPRVIGDYFRSHNYNANLGFKTQWQQAVNVISGGKLTIRIAKGGAPSWDAIKTEYIDKGIPVIVHSNNWAGHTHSMGHCVFIYGIENGVIRYFDPAPPAGASKDRSQEANSVDINTLIIVRPDTDVTFSAIFAPYAAGLVQSAEAANASVRNGYGLTLATTLSNPSSYDVAAVYVEKFIGDKLIKKYKMNLTAGTVKATASKGKYQVVLPGYDNTASFKYRFAMIDGLGMAHPGSFKNVSISPVKPPVVKKVTNSIEKATAKVVNRVQLFFGRFRRR